jgi:hypothetical protein
MLVACITAVILAVRGLVSSQEAPTPEAADAEEAFTGPRCKAFPGDASWPGEEEWSRLNETLGGALLNPLPPASVCYRTSPNYNTDACAFLVHNASQTTFYLDDPLSIANYWSQGNTCLPSLAPTGICARGGYPVYVVNATSVAHVQAAVNFARDKNVRLVIKFVAPERNPGKGPSTDSVQKHGP